MTATAPTGTLDSGTTTVGAAGGIWFVGATAVAFSDSIVNDRNPSTRNETGLTSAIAR